MNNLKIYNNNCRREVLNMYQLEKQESEYKLGKTLSAASNKGYERFCQEDSVIILEHPSNDEIKLLAVADGMGGHGDGDLASNSVIKKVINWFEEEDFTTENFDNIKEDLNNMLMRVLDNTGIRYFAGTTLSLAVIGTEETLIANIGDSRIYTYTNGKLTQETIDDSDVQELYEEEVIPSKELMRFHKISNYITQALIKSPSESKYKYKIQYKTVANDYDKLLAVTDGVTDCLSTKQLEKIVKEEDDNLAETIVNRALENYSYLKDTIAELPEQEKKSVKEISEIIEEDYYKVIKGGKDNATAAVYVRKK